MSDSSPDRFPLRLLLAFFAAVAIHGLVIVGLSHFNRPPQRPKPSAQAIVIDTIELLADDSESAPAPQPTPPESPPPVPDPPPPAPDPPAPEPPPVEPVVEQNIAADLVPKQEEEKPRSPAKPATPKKQVEKEPKREPPVTKPAQAASDRAALAKTVSKAPVSRNTPQPNYPANARRAGIEGVTTIAFKIDTDGKVVAPRVTRSSGNADLDRAALQGVSRWRYTPAVNRLGTAIATATSVNIKFRLR